MSKMAKLGDNVKVGDYVTIEPGEMRAMYTALTEALRPVLETSDPNLAMAGLLLFVGRTLGLNCERAEDLSPMCAAAVSQMIDAAEEEYRDKDPGAAVRTDLAAVHDRVKKRKMN